MRSLFHPQEQYAVRSDLGATIGGENLSDMPYTRQVRGQQNVW